MKMDRKKWKKKAWSRDCSCIKGKNRDTNFNEVIDELCDSFELAFEMVKEIRADEREVYENRIRAMVNKSWCF